MRGRVGRMGAPLTPPTPPVTYVSQDCTCGGCTYTFPPTEPTC